MLSRGFHDALSLWPVAAWPMLFSSAYWAFLRLCRASEQRYGFSPLNGPGMTDRLTTWVYVPAGALFEAAVHLYLLWVIGAPYLLVAMPIFIFGWTALPALLDDFAPAMVLLPAVHLTFAAAFLVLLGFVRIGPLRALNAELYGLLTGVSVSL